MKQLVLIGGPLGVGKTTITQQLKQRLPNSVYLDGDWCRDANPFIVNKETKTMVIDNITFLLNQFIDSSIYQTILFTWVMDHQEIID